MTRRRGQMGKGAAAFVLALALVAMALVGPGVIERILHPARYATSGRALLAPDAYLEARPLTGDERVTRLTLPARDGPVILSVSPGMEVYLDPPTARVLGVVRAGSGEGVRPIEGAQPLASVILRARPYGGGGLLRSVEWPTVRSPDWTVRFGDARTAVKVADDSGTARAAPARESSGATVLTSRVSAVDAWGFPARAAILLSGIVAAIAASGALLRKRAAATAPAAPAPGRTAAPASPRSAGRRDGHDRRSP